MSYRQVQNSGKLKALLRDIFTDDFMVANTNFERFEYFRYSSAVIVNWDAEVMVYDEALLDRFVAESTRFHTFDEMVKAATDRYFKK